MRFSQLGAVAALAVISEAFLVVPVTSSSDNEVVKALPFPNGVGVDGREMALDYPPVSRHPISPFGNMRNSDPDEPTKLGFHYHIQHGNEGESDRLMVNNIQLYPVNPQELYAERVVLKDGKWEVVDVPKLGYALTVGQPHASTEDHLSVVVLQLEVVEVDSNVLDDSPVMEMKLIQTPSGKLMIADSAFVRPTRTSIEDCTTLACKWRAIFFAKLSAMRNSIGKKTGCKGKGPHGSAIAGFRPAHPTSHQNDEFDPTSPPHGRPKHGFHHSHEHGHEGHRPHRFHHRHAFARFMRGLLFHVFIPITIGVVVGITASLVGMIVGHIAIFLWRIVFRRGERAAYHRVQQEESVATKEEQEFALPPPVYEDAPAYVAVVDEKV